MGQSGAAPSIVYQDYNPHLKLDLPTEFVFIDADKGGYSLYYEESVRVLRGGGLIAADNVLRYGRVLSPEDGDSRAIVSFNRRVMSDDRVEKVMLPVRDGVYLIRKI